MNIFQFRRFELSDPDIVVVKVGNGEHKKERLFQMLRSKIGSQSSVLAEHLSKSKSKILTLPDDDPEAFALLAQWILSGALPKPNLKPITIPARGPIRIFKERMIVCSKLIEEVLESKNGKILEETFPSTLRIPDAIELPMNNRLTSLAEIGTRLKNGEYQNTTEIATDLDAFQLHIRAIYGGGSPTTLLATMLEHKIVEKTRMERSVVPNAQGLEPHQTAEGNSEFIAGINLVLMAEKYKIEQLLNPAMDFVTGLGERMAKDSLLRYRKILETYKTTSKKSKLRFYLSRSFIYNMSQGFDSDSEPRLSELVNSREELAKEVFTFLAVVGLEKLSDFSHPNSIGICDYHQHAAGSSCYRTARILPPKRSRLHEDSPRSEEVQTKRPKVQIQPERSPVINKPEGKLLKATANRPGSFILKMRRAPRLIDELQQDSSTILRSTNLQFD